MANTFGVIVSGRLVQTSFTEVEPAKFLTTISPADSINHLVVFLTGVIPLPDGMAGAVYFSFPDPASPPTWIYLGFISNQKPSAIFKVAKLKQMVSNGDLLGGGSGFAYQQSAVAHVAQIGISVEPLTTVAQLTSDPSVSAAESGTRMEAFTRRAAENLYNYCCSFANTVGHFATTGAPTQQVVPMTTINQWYTRFVQMIQQNPDQLWRQ